MASDPRGHACPITARIPAPIRELAATLAGLAARLTREEPKKPQVNAINSLLQ